MQNDFTFCPKCGGRNTNNGTRKWLCPDCGFELYNNVAAAVGLVIQTKPGTILFERRAKNPRKGFLAFPGGFVDPDEPAEEACRRECAEETGVQPQSLNYIASFPNTYDYNGIRYKTCDLFFEAVLPEHAVLKAQEGEVLSFEEHSVDSEEEIENLPLAFESAANVLKLWLKRRNNK